MSRQARRIAARLNRQREKIADATGRLAFTVWATAAGCTMEAASDPDRFPLRTDEDFRQAEAKLSQTVQDMVAKLMTEGGRIPSDDERRSFTLRASREANLAYIEMAARFRDACARRVAELERAA